METLRLPGLIDPHVHLREPGATHKEDIATGTAAALAGGVVGVLDMPNNQPPTVDRAAWEDKLARLRASARVDYGAFLGWVGGSLDPLIALGPQAVGLKLYLDETFGHLIVDRTRLAEVFAAWPGPGPIAIHAESDSIRVALDLARATGARLHICHVPQPDDLLAIEEARQRGVRVTCEVTPHHLFLSSADAARLGPYGQMKPPLVSSQAVALFWERLSWVDCIGSDHAPHTRAEKEGAQPPPGVPGLETTLPLLLGAVGQGRLTLERAIALTHSAALAIYGLRAPEETEVVADWGEPYALPATGYRTKCGWSPFAGCLAQGRVLSVRLRGQLAWADGRVQVEPGYGRSLERESAGRS